MKEIRYYIKRITEFPESEADLNHLQVSLLWNDVLYPFTKELGRKKELAGLDEKEISEHKNLLGLHAVIAYLLSDKEGEFSSFSADALISFLKNKLVNYSVLVTPYTEWTRDGERAEELVRALFSELFLLPKGEEEKYFQDRFRSIDTMERIRILEESKKAQERAKEILRKIKEAEEQEAASKYNRE
ncbi:hypothetical protein [Leptospira idonii]|uniref:Uncharacterized protein n=1 Tax=Leptospira idonii TaxID=1193500 RepID=A0A4R9M4J0_9LEPT|nr:hypothetical protein [Leptospira idonii]TGN20992.1 hypothetical protein EHS15_00270 [Leptospira idonii]